MRPRIVQRLALLLLGCLSAGCGSDTVTGAADCSGTRLVVFASNPGQFDIYLFDFDRGGFRSLGGINSPTAADSNPSITTGGTVIAFESDRAGNQDILVFDRCAGGLVARPELATSWAEKDPSFTWDEERLAFTRDTVGGSRIRLVEGRSARLVPLPGLDSTGFDDWSPAPDLRGNRIAFLSNRKGNPDLFVYDAGGDSLLDLSDLISPGEEADPWLSPDGRWLAFASNRAGGQGDFDLWLYDLESRAFATLATGVNSAAREGDPNFSLDRTRLLFTSNRAGSEGGRDLYTSVGNLQPVRSAASTTGWDAAPRLLHP
jgi:Tol biopolymer transport system component